MAIIKNCIKCGKKTHVRNFPRRSTWLYCSECLNADTRLLTLMINDNARIRVMIELGLIDNIKIKTLGD